jgi:hypothetical protein
VDSFDFRSRAPEKGVLSGVPLDIVNQYRQKKNSRSSRAHRLTRMDNEKEEQSCIIVCIICDVDVS